jgi:hypothetical protein
MKMRYLFGFMKATLPYSLHVFFKKIKIINAPKESLGRTFFAINHPSSFMDPLLPGALCKPIIHYMARADVHKGFMKHVYYHAHIMPIFRQQDGIGNQEKNEEIFKVVAKEVKAGKNIFVYAEGFTDDVFIRHLKPLKKGIARMAFFTLESLDWKEDVYLQALGTNYTNPGVFRSELVLHYGEKFRLNDYKDLYKENPTKAILDVMELVEEQMKQQITFVEDLERCDFHEQIMRLTRKGMNHENTDFSIPLEKRFHYSQQLALWVNAQDDANIAGIKNDLNTYFSRFEATKIIEEDVYEFSKTGKLNTSKQVLFNILLAPIALLGLLHGWISYFVIKPKIEKAFKRQVFWSSVKLVASHFISGIYNLLLLIPFYFFVFPSVLAGLLYLVLVVGPSFVVFHKWMKNTRELKRKSKINPVDLKTLSEKRKDLVCDLQNILPKELL